VTAEYARTVRIVCVRGVSRGASDGELIWEPLKAVCIRFCALLAAALMLVAAAPQSASAHGATDPVATSYLARIKSVPAVLTAKVVDGDLRLWLRAPAGKTVVVLDNQGAPYLRFAHGRVWANQDSEMYYFNQNPPVDPPLGLKRDAPERWLRVASGYTYEWHDGRLHAFAMEAVAPGSAFAGPWRIPVLINGRRSAVSGSLWYRGGPSIVWLWPMVVLVLCVLAAWRLQDARVDALTARGLAGLTLFGITLAAIGRDLHGRPGISGFGAVELALITAFTVWAALRVGRDRAGSFTLFVITVVAVWEGLSLFPTLFNGFVLLAIPPFLGRLATIICLGGAIALVFPIVRLLRSEERDADSELADDEVASALA